MVWAKNLLSDGQAPFEKGLRIFETTLLAVHVAEIVETDRDRRVIRPEGLLLDGERGLGG